MTYEEVIQKFLNQISILKSKNLTYRQPGDGSDGTCDCIGLIIGACGRMGLKWTGIHGSNWAARKELVQLCMIGSPSQLEVGDIVFKGYEPSAAKYKLPDRYKPKGAYYNGDLRDYYHVGVVTSVNPLRITHMTSPTVKVDTSLGKWAYFGKLRLLVNAAGGVTPAPAPAPTPTPKPVPSTGTIATVTAKSGKYVKMRKEPSTSCGLYEEVPVGAKVSLDQPGEKWAKISYGSRKGWYMMAEFLNVA